MKVQFSFSPGPFLFPNNKVRSSWYSDHNISLLIVCHCLLSRYHLRFLWDCLPFLLKWKIYQYLCSSFLPVLCTYLLSNNGICFIWKIFLQLFLSLSFFSVGTLSILWLKKSIFVGPLGNAYFTRLYSKVASNIKLEIVKILICTEIICYKVHVLQNISY